MHTAVIALPLPSNCHAIWTLTADASVECHPAVVPVIETVGAMPRRSSVDTNKKIDHEPY